MNWSKPSFACRVGRSFLLLHLLPRRYHPQYHLLPPLDLPLLQPLLPPLLPTNHQHSAADVIWFGSSWQRYLYLSSGKESARETDGPSRHFLFETTVLQLQRSLLRHPLHHLTPLSILLKEMLVEAPDMLEAMAVVATDAASGLVPLRCTRR